MFFEFFPVLSSGVPNLFFFFTDTPFIVSHPTHHLLALVYKTLVRGSSGNQSFYWSRACTQEEGILQRLNVDLLADRISLLGQP